MKNIEILIWGVRKKIGEKRLILQTRLNCVERLEKMFDVSKLQIQVDNRAEEARWDVSSS